MVIAGRSVFDIVQLINFRVNTILYHNIRNNLNIYNIKHIKAAFITAIESKRHSWNFQLTRTWEALTICKSVRRVFYGGISFAQHKKDVVDESGIFQT